MTTMYTVSLCVKDHYPAMLFAGEVVELWKFTPALSHGFGGEAIDVTFGMSLIEYERTGRYKTFRTSTFRSFILAVLLYNANALKYKYILIKVCM